MDIVSELNANRQNLTALRTVLAPSWVSAPNYRGTTSILWSCLVTLIACIYSAIHINIPNTTSKWRILLLKGLWVFLALLAPEIVLYCAFHQYSEAIGLISSLNKLRRESGKGRQQAPQDFEIQYGFFVVMGGLRISTSAVSKTENTMGLTPAGILELARQGYFICIAPEDIEDKSKASLLQKGLVVFQVLWMAIQCVARRIYGLPLTLVEIHTMVHVVCALLMYTFWFNKPQDIASPQIVTKDEEFDQIIAFMILETLHTHKYVESYLDNIVIYPPYSEETSTTTFALHRYAFNHDTEKTPSSSAKHPLEWIDQSPMTTNGIATLRNGQALKCGFGLVQRAKSVPPTLDLNPKEIELWNRAATFTRRHDAGKVQYPNLFHAYTKGPRYGTSSFHKALTITPSNFPTILDRKGKPISGVPNTGQVAKYFGKLPIFATIAVLLPIAYGGIHLAALNFDFPTNTERLLWEIACYDIMATVPVIVLLVLVTVFVSVCMGVIFDEIEFGLGVDILVYIFLLFYGVSRVSLVVESFASLRSLPIGVFWTPSWVQMLPHI